jgi:hypothetical protein
MKRLLAVVATGAAALAVGTAPAAPDNGPPPAGDPFSTNCDQIASLAGQVPAGALLAIAGLLQAGTPFAQIQTHFPNVTFTTTADGGCLITVHHQ